MRRAEFPFDWSIVGEPEDDPHPLEFTVRARGVVFRDGTAAGDATWVTETQEDRKRLIQQFATELKLLAQIAQLEDAKAILQTPLKGAVRAFWLENQGNLSDDRARWAAFINRRTSELQSLIEVMSQRPDLTMDDK